MPKGKKFNAAEKHFFEKELTYKKQIAGYTGSLVQCNKRISELMAINENLFQENAQMKEWIDRLLQYTELSISDIKLVCEKDKAMSNMFNLLNTVCKYM